jgi:hypothetical protein
MGLDSVDQLSDRYGHGTSLRRGTAQLHIQIQIQALAGASEPSRAASTRLARAGHTSNMFPDFPRILHALSRFVPLAPAELRNLRAGKFEFRQPVRWCCERGLNSRPLPYQGSALPLSYRSAPVRRGRDRGSGRGLQRRACKAGAASAPTPSPRCVLRRLAPARPASWRGACFVRRAWPVDIRCQNGDHCGRTRFCGRLTIRPGPSRAEGE